MRVVHDPAGAATPIATDVDLAEGHLARARGLMFRRAIPEDYALVFDFGRAGRRTLHMVFVPFDIDAVWLVDGEVRQVARLSAWTGLRSARADTVIELPAGAADPVEPGHHVAVE